MKIFSNPSRWIPSAVIAPVACSLVGIFKTRIVKNPEEVPIKFKKIGNSPHVVSISPKDAKRLSDQNLARKFKEALEAPKKLE